MDKMPADYGTFKWAVRQCSVGEHCVNPLLPQHSDWRLVSRGGRIVVAQYDKNGIVQTIRQPDKYEVASTQWRIYDR